MIKKQDRIEFRCTSEFKFNLILLAQKKGLTVSKLIMNILSDYLEKEGFYYE